MMMIVMMWKNDIDDCLIDKCCLIDDCVKIVV